MAFRLTLREAQGFAGALAREIAAAPRSEIGNELKQLASDQLANKEAIEQLNIWAEAGEKAYVHYGSKLQIQDIIPGVKVRVLGPPTLEQHDQVRSQRAKDPNEFWMLYRRLVRGAQLASVVKKLSSLDP
jgi:hypothetical protein